MNEEAAKDDVIAAIESENESLATNGIDQQRPTTLRHSARMQQQNNKASASAVASEPVVANKRGRKPGTSRKK